MRVELRQRTIGEMAGLSFSLSADMFGPLFIILLICNLPHVFVQLFLMPDLNKPEGDPMVLLQRVGIAVGVMSAVSLITFPLQEGALVHLVAGPFLGERRTILGSFKAAFKRYGSILMLLLALGVITILGFFAAIVPYFIFSAWFYVALPVMMFERVGWIQALQRARALAHGRTMECLGIFLVTRFLLPMFIGPVLLLPATVLADYYFASVLLQYLFTLMTSMIWMVAPVIAYFHLRVVKEAYDVERLADLVPLIGERGAAQAASGQLPLP